jgi:hypothetical protein
MGIEKIKAKLNEVIDQAQVRLDLETAGNPALRRAIHIVESFLQRTGRVCYGGQAINAQLPQKDQFYNPETSLPDYDFFSPDAKADTDSLIADFKQAGYTEISKRIGIHEGTTKIYVNFTAIADITQVIPEFYENISKKSVSVNGIHYADPIFLRMMMYLELSRPRGQLERWNKVYERLTFLDNAHPLTSCKNKTPPIYESQAASEARPNIVRFMIAKKRVFMGADIEVLYRPNGARSAASRTKFLLRGSAPVIFLSPDADMDGDQLSEITHTRKVHIKGYQNILPAMTALYMEDTLVALIVQEEACHSIVSFPLTKQRYLRAASLDTLLTFLIGLYYRDDISVMAEDSLLCWLKQYIDLSNRYKSKPTKLIPAFSIECSGYQTTFASLLRAKGARIEAERQKVSSGVRETKTLKAKRGRYVNYGTRKSRHH